MLYFQLRDMTDPEERAENAILWKTLKDFYGDDIEPLEPGCNRSLEGFIFGSRVRKGISVSKGPGPLPYWEDPAFLNNCRRYFKACDLDEAKIEVEKMQSEGKNVFLKSVISKHFILSLGPDDSYLDNIDDAIYTLANIEGPCLMVQEHAEVKYERRFFVIDRDIITESPIAYHLTPIVFYLYEHQPTFHLYSAYEKPGLIEPEDRLGKELEFMREKVKKIAREMKTPHAVIDMALINGEIGCVEFNPMILGNIGLFACNVEKLVKASPSLIPDEHKPERFKK